MKTEHYTIIPDSTARRRESNFICQILYALRSRLRRHIDFCWSILGSRLRGKSCPTMPGTTEFGVDASACVS